MGSRNDCSLLLLLTGILLGRGSSSSDSNLRLLVLGNRKSLTGRSETVKSVATLAADVSVRMVSHVGSDLASGALTFQSLDLAGSFNVAVVEEGEGSLSMLVLCLLGLGVDLFLTLVSRSLLSFLVFHVPLLAVVFSVIVLNVVGRLSVFGFAISEWSERALFQQGLQCKKLHLGPTQ